jgi:hypothetical protein
MPVVPNFNRRHFGKEFVNVWLNLNSKSHPFSQNSE